MNKLQEHFTDKFPIYVLVAVLSGLMLFYYFVYVPNNERKLNDQALRLMDNKVRSIKEKYNAYQGAINTAPVSYFAHWYFTTHPDAKSVVYYNYNATYHYSDTTTNFPLHIPPVERLLKSDFWYVKYDANLRPQVYGPDKNGSDKDIWKTKSGDYYFVYSPDLNFVEHKLNPTTEISADTAYHYLWLKIRDFTSNLKSSPFFEDMFLLRDTNDKGNFNAKSLEISGFDSQVLDDSKLGLVRLSLPAEAGKSGIGVYEEQIMGKPYKVYYKLVKLKKGLNVYAVGLISTRTFERYSRQIPTWFLVFCAIGALILVLLLPVLKLFFQNEHERLSAMDARLSVFSLLMCVSLLIIVLLGSYIYWVPEAENYDNNLKKISGKISNAFGKEVDSLKSAIGYDHLFFFNDAVRQEDFDTAYFKSKNLNFNEVLSLTKLGFVHNVFFRGDNQKYTMKTYPVRLSEREYFRMIKTANESGDTLDYHMVAINSFISGKGEVAVSIPAPVGRPEYVRVITSSLPSLINTRMPSPYKFVVVDRIGDVVFHSDWSEVRFENFVNECNNDGILSAYFENEVEGFADFNYLRSECRGYSKPLRKGWSVLVYYELGNTRGLAAHVFGMCLVTLVLINIFIVFLQIVLSLDNWKPVLLKIKPFPYDWLNPNYNSQHRWISLFWINVSLLIVELLWLLFNTETLISLFFISSVIGLTYIICYRKLNAYRKTDKPLRSVKFILAMFALSVIAMVATSLIDDKGVLIWILLPMGVVFFASEYFPDQPRWFYNVFTRHKEKSYNPYRAFLISSLLVFAVGPSVILTMNHYRFQNFIAEYAYLLDDVKRVQVRSSADQLRSRGKDYTDSLAVGGDFSPVKTDQLDFMFYRHIPRYSINDVSVTGMRFNYIPHYKDFDVSASSNAVRIAAPSNLNNDRHDKLVRSRIINIQLFPGVTATVLLLIGFIALMFLCAWAVKETSERIFFMPEFDVWERYPPRVFDENAINREFENDNLSRHPLHNFIFKRSFLNKFKSIYENHPEESRAVQVEKLFIDLEQSAKARYDKIWVENCSDKEKFLLYDLADDGIANQSNVDLIRSLSEKGLVRVIPKLEVVNISFANYVKDKLPKDKITEWRQTEEKQGSWKNLRIALIIIIIAICAFLSIAEEEFMGRVSALIASVSLIIPNIVTALGHVTKLFKK